MPNVIETYRGYPISLTNSHRFEIGDHYQRGKDLPEPSLFDSKKEARAHIDAHATAIEETNLALEVVGRDGKRRTLTGLNRNTSNLNGTGGETVYPDIPWIHVEVERHQKLVAELDRIRERLRPFEVNARGYGRIHTEAEYSRKVQEIKADYQERRAAAEAAAPGGTTDA